MWIVTYEVVDTGAWEVVELHVPATTKKGAIRAARRDAARCGYRARAIHATREI